MIRFCENNVGLIKKAAEMERCSISLIQRENMSAPCDMIK